MYEMYPDSWGPAKHREEPGADDARRAVQRSFDPRDAHAERPDDN